MGKSQRRKGAAGEREFAKLLSERLGRKITRRLGQARDGGEDIVCGPLVFEVKRRRRISVLRWIEQVEAATPVGKYPVVALREDGGAWHVMLPAAAFLKLAGVEIRDASL